MTSERDAMDNRIARKLINRPANDRGPSLVQSTQPSGAGSDDRTVQAFRNPMTGIGDLITGLQYGSPGRLAPGAEGEILAVGTGSVLEWIPAPSGTYSDEQAQDAIGTVLVDSSSIDLTYNDATPSITAAIIDEYVRDLVGALLVAGTNVTITVNDPGDTITIAATGGSSLIIQEEDATVVAAAATLDFAGAGFNVTDEGSGEARIENAITQYTDEMARDAIGAALVAGNNIDITVNDPGDTITIDVEALTAADVTDFAEAVDDRVATLLVPGNNIDLTYNDGANTLTVDVESLTSADISDFTEAAQDATGAMIADTSSINLTYTDATPELKAEIIDAYVQALIDASIIANDDPDEEYAVPTSWIYTHRMGYVSVNPNAATFTSVYLALTNQGTPTADDAADGNWAIFTSATGVNSTAGMTSVAHAYYADWNLTVWARIKTGTITGCRIWICYQGTVSPTLTDAPNGSFVGFRFSTVAGDTNWQCMSGNSAANTQTTDSGITVAADTPYVMRIVFGTAKVKFYINEVLVATHTTHRPATVTRLTNHGTVITNTVGGGGTARTLRIGRIHIATIK